MFCQSMSSNPDQLILWAELTSKGLPRHSLGPQIHQGKKNKNRKENQKPQP